jgi:hypothetical protein
MALVAESGLGGDLRETHAGAFQRDRSRCHAPPTEGFADTLTAPIASLISYSP